MHVEKILVLLEPILRDLVLAHRINILFDVVVYKHDVHDTAFAEDLGGLEVLNAEVAIPFEDDEDVVRCDFYFEGFRHHDWKVGSSAVAKSKNVNVVAGGKNAQVAVVVYYNQRFALYLRFP